MMEIWNKRDEMGTNSNFGTPKKQMIDLLLHSLSCHVLELSGKNGWNIVCSQPEFDSPPTVLKTHSKLNENNMLVLAASA